MSDRQDPVEQLPDAAWRKAFRRRLLGWYRQHARDLPWRGSRDPYAIWVSEIMLQQTQVATVELYFQRFIQRFPDIAALARASEQEVLRCWEVLGYYRRARALHQAAQKIVNEWGGQFPRDPHQLQSLPGIGRYTAGAILSIAFDNRQPILEANTIRLLSRLLAYRGDTTRSEGQSLLWTFSTQLLPRRDVGSFNQALMEVGSCICKPLRPDCGNCPVRAHCQACTLQIQESIPSGKRQVTYEDLREAAVVIRRQGRVLLRRCQSGERWEGLWDFPRFQIRSTRAGSLRREIEQKTHRLTGIGVRMGERLARIKHGVTRFRITLECYDADYVVSEPGPSRNLQKWVTRSRLQEYPLSVTGRRISRLIS